MDTILILYRPAEEDSSLLYIELYAEVKDNGQGYIHVYTGDTPTCDNYTTLVEFDANVYDYSLDLEKALEDLVIFKVFEDTIPSYDYEVIEQG